MRIIVNADDFGASAETVRDTIACIERGAVTSATIMIGMPAAPAAVEYAVDHPAVSVGVHLTLTGDGSERPIAAAGRLPTLVDGDGHFLPTGEARRRALLGKLAIDELEIEIAAQLQAAVDAGLSPSHVDSHRHLHKLGPVRAALERVLPGFGIDRVRAVQDVWLRRPIRRPTYWLGPVWSRRLTSRFRTTDHFYMPSASGGEAHWPDSLAVRIPSLGDGTLEVGVHPGEGDWRGTESRAAVRFAGLAEEAGHQLVTWKDALDGLGQRGDEALARASPRADRSRAARAPSARCRAGACPRARPGSMPGPARMNSPVLRVVRVVGAGVVLEGVDALVAADRADGAPEEVAEVDDQVGRDAVDLGVDLLRA